MTQVLHFYQTKQFVKMKNREQILTIWFDEH